MAMRKIELKHFSSEIAALLSELIMLVETATFEFIWWSKGVDGPRRAKSSERSLHHEITPTPEQGDSIRARTGL